MFWNCRMINCTRELSMHSTALHTGTVECFKTVYMRLCPIAPMRELSMHNFPVYGNYRCTTALRTGTFYEQLPYKRNCRCTTTLSYGNRWLAYGNRWLTYGNNCLWEHLTVHVFGINLPVYGGGEPLLEPEDQVDWVVFGQSHVACKSSRSTHCFLDPRSLVWWGSGQKCA